MMRKMKNLFKKSFLVIIIIGSVCGFSFSQNNVNQTNINVQARGDSNQVNVNATISQGGKIDTTLNGMNQGGSNVLDGVYVREHYPARKPIPYAFLREADVMWSKRVWRQIEINEKINLIFKYPREGTTHDRTSFIQLLINGIKEGTLTAYDAAIDDEFTKRLTKAEFERKISGHLDSVKVPIPDPPYEKDTMELKGRLILDDIIRYRIKEDWFFDKQRSVMDVRIIGICPISLSRDEQGNLLPEPSPLFWIYFPEARRILANNEVFNTHNDAERKTWDDIFFKRMFGSYIYKESNVYDRRIADYKLGMDQLIEAAKIHDDMVNFEHDMWEY